MAEKKDRSDGRSGLSCPEPVMMTRKALATQKSGTVEVLVDSGTSRDNVRRLRRAVRLDHHRQRCLRAGSFQLGLTK